MKWIEMRVQFEAAHPEVAGELIADAFHDLGLQGVVIEDPHLDHTVDWAPDSPSLPAQHAIIGYLADNVQLAARLAALKEALEKLAVREAVALKLSQRRVDETEWAEAWKAYFKPIRVGERIVVKPTWEAWDKAPGELIIEIDPGMAFGTGTHPTTALCLELLEAHLKPGDDCLDIGTGSGILMAAAAQLGARRLSGVDTDAVAVETARGNLELNRVDPAAYDLHIGNLTLGMARQYTLATANIITPVILQLLDLIGNGPSRDAAPVLVPGGRLIVSGILAENRAQVAEKMQQAGFDVIESRDLDGWTALVGVLRESPVSRA